MLQDIPDYNPETMISVREAKEYAMNRRFEMKPDDRIRVNRAHIDSQDIYPYAYTEKVSPVQITPFHVDTIETVLLRSFMAWDRNAINMMGDKGAYFDVFDRKAFIELFSNYPQK